MGKLKFGDSAGRLVSERIGKAVATVAALTAMPARDRVDGMLVLVTGTGDLWQFNGTSSATANADVKAPDAGSGRWFRQGASAATIRPVRGVVFANVANLASFTVAGNDGLTYVEGERVLLANQTTAAQCGIYVVGAVAAGAAALTRASDMPSGAAVVNGQMVTVSEGTLFAGSTWKAMCTGAKVVGTDDPLFYPQNCRGTATLVAGTVTLGSTQGLFLWSTTRSSVNVTRNTANTTALTVDYYAPVASRVAGKSGTGAVVVTAAVAAGTINNADISTVDWLVTNW